MATVARGALLWTHCPEHRVLCCLFPKLPQTDICWALNVFTGSAELSLARTQQGSTAARERCVSGGLHCLCKLALSQLGKAWWVLRHPGWMDTGPGCPELGAATGRLSGWILTVAEGCGDFQIQTQALGLPNVRPVDHLGFGEMHPGP